MSGWSDISLRARATTVIPSAVMYKAHTVLTRGRSTVEKGYLWIKGKGASVIRYVDAPAYTAHAAHLAVVVQPARPGRRCIGSSSGIRGGNEHAGSVHVFEH